MYNLKNHIRDIQINGNIARFYDEGGACFARSSEGLYLSDGTKYTSDILILMGKTIFYLIDHMVRMAMAIMLL